VKIDTNTANAWVEGPMTKYEKAELDEWLDQNIIETREEA